MEIGSISKHMHEVGGNYLVRTVHLACECIQHESLHTDLASLLLNIVVSLKAG